MYKTRNLLQVGNHSLGEAFIVTGLVKEVVAVDNDDFSTYLQKPGQKRTYKVPWSVSDAPMRSRRKISPYCWYKSIYEFVGASLSIEARLPKKGIFRG